MNVQTKNPEQATKLLADIDHQLSALTTQIRHLAHQLYPPELELLGLVGALRERVQVQPTLQVLLDAPDSLPTLPAEIETAVYTIALEAITNIEKHAHAQTCRIHLRLDGTGQLPILQLDIQDDGDGMSGPISTGLGLLSMQARAVEVGGVCQVTENPDGVGTAVTVRIPCPGKVE
jgi:signal transduction histidine kinase